MSVRTDMGGGGWIINFKLKTYCCLQCINHVSFVYNVVAAINVW